jgi:hypothetical protein
VSVCGGLDGIPCAPARLPPAARARGDYPASPGSWNVGARFYFNRHFVEPESSSVNGRAMAAAHTQEIGTIMRIFKPLGR